MNKSFAPIQAFWECCNWPEVQYTGWGVRWLGLHPCALKKTSKVIFPAFYCFLSYFYKQNTVLFWAYCMRVKCFLLTGRCKCSQAFAKLFQQRTGCVLLNRRSSWYEVSTAAAKSKNEKWLVLWSLFKLWLQFNEATKRRGIAVNGSTVISGQTGADALPSGSCNRACTLFGVGDVSHLDCTGFSTGWGVWWTVRFSRLETFVDISELDRAFV